MQENSPETSRPLDGTPDFWMARALQEAAEAAAEGEVPVGAVAVLEGRLVANDHNRCIQRNDPTAHAEILVIRAAAEILGNYRLNGLDLYVTLEPCAMCAGALVWARVRSLFFGAQDEKAGAVVSREKLLREGLFNHKVEVSGGIGQERSREMLRSFFEERR